MQIRAVAMPGPSDWRTLPTLPNTVTVKMNAKMLPGSNWRAIAEIAFDVVFLEAEKQVTRIKGRLDPGHEVLEDLSSECVMKWQGCLLMTSALFPFFCERLVS